MAAWTRVRKVVESGQIQGIFWGKSRQELLRGKLEGVEGGLLPVMTPLVRAFWLMEKSLDCRQETGLPSVAVRYLASQ